MPRYTVESWMGQGWIMDRSWLDSCSSHVMVRSWLGHGFVMVESWLGHG